MAIPSHTPMLPTLHNSSRYGTQSILPSAPIDGFLPNTFAARDLTSDGVRVSLAWDTWEEGKDKMMDG